ncbi:MAG TPA: putative quinol monooxygenase [Hyphomonadaceae bacterium]|nr:putative quinol monooxygenase [Hyphomonadaceae bacterium]
MLVLSVNLRVPKAEQERLRPHMEAVVNASRRESGCLAYSYGFDLLDPDLIRVFEVYKDDDALKAHVASDHFKRWREISGQYPREDRTLYDATKRP